MEYIILTVLLDTEKGRMPSYFKEKTVKVPVAEGMRMRFCESSNQQGKWAVSIIC